MVDIYERAGKTAQVGVKLAVEGLGAAGGLIGGKFVGDIVEKAIVAPILPTSSMTDKLMGWMAQNLPKGIAAYAAHEMNPEKDLSEKTSVGNFVEGISYGLSASIVVDSYARATNSGAPILVLGNKAADTRVQALLRENSELKQAIQRAGNSPLVRVEHVPQNSVLEGPQNSPLQRKYEFTPGEGIPGVVFEKRPLEKQYQFTGKDITAEEVLTTGFGFLA